MRWHKYPDEKPKKDGLYLVTLNYTGLDFEKVPRRVNISRFFRDKFDMVDCFVEAWAELPEPYKEEAYGLERT